MARWRLENATSYGGARTLVAIGTLLIVEGGSLWDSAGLPLGGAALALVGTTTGVGSGKHTAEGR
jgi:hypothetical protein